MVLGLAWPLAVVAGSPAGEPLRPIPRMSRPDPARVALGKRLFHDTRLSVDHRMACASCHPVSRGGADGRPLARARDGSPDDFNTPTVFNAVLNDRLGWRGNLASLGDQVDDSLGNPRHMGMSWDGVVDRLRADPGYRRAFHDTYGGITPDNVRDAIVSYEQTLVTPDARFDRYLRGEDDAITPLEKRGYAYFKDYGCVACHQGVNVGGNLVQKYGVFGDPYAGRPGKPRSVDLGRYSLTGDPQDKRLFRVPSLRNVALTAPYFHDGSAATLTEAVRRVARLQLGIEMPADHVCAIVHFLYSLSGVYQGRLLEHLAGKPPPC